MSNFFECLDMFKELKIKLFFKSDSDEICKKNHIVYAMKTTLLAQKVHIW